MRADAHCIQDLTLNRDKIIGERIYNENKHKRIRVMVPTDFSAKVIKPAKVKPPKEGEPFDYAASSKKRTAENTERCVEWLIKNGPATSQEVATGTGISTKSVRMSLAHCKRVRSEQAPEFITKTGSRYRLFVWSVPGAQPARAS